MENKDKIILHLCASEYGSDTRDYRKAGYDVRLITEDIDVRTYEPPENVYGIIANPPCTMFSVARTVAKTPRNFDQGLEIVMACLRIIWTCQKRIKSENQRNPPLKFWCLENPEGKLRWFLGKPAFIYQPFEFGADYSKKTNLWGQFNEPARLFFNRQLPPKSNIVDKYNFLNEGIGKSRDFKKLTDLRSIVSEEFTRAFYLSNP